MILLVQQAFKPISEDQRETLAVMVTVVCLATRGNVLDTKIVSKIVASNKQVQGHCTPVDTVLQLSESLSREQFTSVLVFSNTEGLKHQIMTSRFQTNLRMLFVIRSRVNVDLFGHCIPRLFVQNVNHCKILFYSKCIV